MKRVSMRNFFLLGAALIMALFAACSKDGNVYDPVPKFNADLISIKAHLRKTSLVAVQDSASGIFNNITNPGNGIDTVKSGFTKVKTFYKGQRWSALYLILL